MTIFYFIQYENFCPLTGKFNIFVFIVIIFIVIFGLDAFYLSCFILLPVFFLISSFKLIFAIFHFTIQFSPHVSLEVVHYISILSLVVNHILSRIFKNLKSKVNTYLNIPSKQLQGTQHTTSNFFLQEFVIKLFIQNIFKKFFLLLS